MNFLEEVVLAEFSPEEISGLFLEKISGSSYSSWIRTVHGDLILRGLE